MTALVIIAGGKGTRLKDVLYDRPKPMAIINDKPFLYWIISFFVKKGIKEVLISTGYMGNYIDTYFKKNPINNVEIKCFAESEELGTAGGVIYTIKNYHGISKNFVVCNGDSLFLSLKIKINQEDDLVIYGNKVYDTHRYGSLLLDSKDYLIGFKEKIQGQGYINAGVYNISRKIIDKLEIKKMSFEYDLFPFLINGGARIKVIKSNAPFIDIGTKDSLLKADSFIKKNINYFM